MFETTCKYCGKLIRFEEKDIQKRVEDAGVYLQENFCVLCDRCKTYCLISDEG